MSSNNKLLSEDCSAFLSELSLIFIIENQKYILVLWFFLSPRDRNNGHFVEKKCKFLHIIIFNFVLQICVSFFILYLNFFLEIRWIIFLKNTDYARFFYAMI